MRTTLKWASLVVLSFLFSCTHVEEIGDFSNHTKPGVYGYMTPIVAVDEPASKATVDPDKLGYSFEVGDYINVWANSGTLLIYTVEEISNNGRNCKFNGGGFALSENETYYSAFPLIKKFNDNYHAISTSFEDQLQVTDGDASHLAEYTYAYASAKCIIKDGEPDASFSYRRMNSYMKFVLTLPEALTLSKLEIAVENAEDDSFFALNGTANIATGVFTGVAKSNIMELELGGAEGLQVTDGVLNAYLAIAPCDAAEYVIRITAKDGTIYTSPKISKPAIPVNSYVTFTTEVFEGTTPMVAKIGETLYASLAEAIAAVQEGVPTTITMIGNETIPGNAGVTVPANKTITLDLNNNTVTLAVTESKGSQLITNNGVLTITDTSTKQGGKLTNAPAEGLEVGTWPTNNYVTNIVSNTGTLTIEGGNIQNTAAGSICYAVDNNSTSRDAVLNVNGGYLTSVGTVVRQFCNSTTNQNVLNISGGTIETNGSAAVWTQLPGSSATSKKLATLNITGGVISASSNAWYDYSFGDSFEAVNYSISGGQFGGDLFSYAVKDGIKPGFITGGVFSDITYEYQGTTYDSDWLSLIAEGYVMAINTDPATMSDYPYTVVEDPSSFVAQIGDNKFKTLAAAIATVPADGTETTITMIGNETISGNAGVTIAAGKNVVLDLNGKTITGAFDQPSTAQVISNKGTLTITDSSDGQNGTITVSVSDENAGSPSWNESTGTWDKNWASNVIRNDGVLVMNAGNLVNSGNGSACYAIDNYTAASLTVNGGTLDAKRASAVRFFYSEGGSVTINDGIIGSSDSYIGLQIMAARAAGINVTITGGTFSGEEGFYAGGTGNGVTWANAQFNISGGTFVNGASFTAAISADNINIAGGEYHEYLVSYGFEKFIKAGRFTEDAMYASAGYLADGYKFVQDGTMYVVVPNSDPREAIPTNTVYYYWLNNDGSRGGGYYNFYAPFEGPDPVLMDGEFIELLGNIQLTKTVTYLDECSFGDPISKGGTFYLTFGDFNIDLNGHAFPLPTGVSVKTDKQTDVFSATEAGYQVVETTISEGDFHYQYTIAANVAKIGNVGYTSLEAAFAAAVDGNTITLLADCAGNGIIAPQGKFATGLTVDFNNHTYDFSGTGVGSSGTETNGFQLLMGNTITFKNGTLTASSEEAGFLIQNYSNLTLDNMTVDGTGVWGGYVISNNNGNTVINNTTITAPEGDFAFDVCRYASYPSVNVTVQGTSVINGNIEVSASGSDPKDGFSLMIKSGTINGALVIDGSAATAMASDPDKAVVKKTTTHSLAAPDGYKWVDNGNGTCTLAPASYVAQVGDVKYETLVEAVAATTSGTITLLKDAEGAGIFVAATDNKNITIDFNGHSYAVTGPAVGSTGTQSQALHLEKDNTIVLKNGTVTSTADSGVKMLVQNYSNLTLDNMVLDGTHLPGNAPYTMSNNNGNVLIKNSTLNTAANGYAFDVWCIDGYNGAHVTVENSAINGKVDVGSSVTPANLSLELQLKGSTTVNEITMSNNSDKALVQKESSVTVTTIPEDYKWNNSGILVLKNVAQVNGTKYETLVDAVAATSTGTITLLADAEGAGLFVAEADHKNITIDFNGHSYTVTGPAVGSAGTQSQALHLEKDNTIVLKNGTVTSTAGSGVLMLVQNYSNLTLDNMVLDGTNLPGTKPYTLSNNNGNVVIKDTEINAKTGGFAFDVCRYASYPSVHVTVQSGSTINGNVEVYASNNDAKEGFSLMLETALNGNIVVDSSAAAAMVSTPDKAVVSKKDGVNQAAPSGYSWVSDSNGTSHLEAN